MSLKELQTDFNMIIKPQLEEILTLLKNQEANTSKCIEAAAAKIITEIKSAMTECNCNKEILEALGKQPKNKETQVLPYEREIGRLSLYSYPHNRVGNAELGTGRNPNSLTWPFGESSTD